MDYVCRVSGPNIAYVCNPCKRRFRRLEQRFFEELPRHRVSVTDTCRNRQCRSITSICRIWRGLVAESFPTRRTETANRCRTGHRSHRSVADRDATPLRKRVLSARELQRLGREVSQSGPFAALERDVAGMHPVLEAVYGERQARGGLGQVGRVDLLDVAEADDLGAGTGARDQRLHLT